MAQDFAMCSMLQPKLFKIVDDSRTSSDQSLSVTNKMSYFIKRLKKGNFLVQTEPIMAKNSNCSLIKCLTKDGQILIQIIVFRLKTF